MRHRIGRTRRDNLFVWKCRLRRNKEVIKSELNFEDNFTCFPWRLGFISSNVIQDKQRWNQIISLKKKASLARDYSNSDQDCTRGKNVASNTITTTSTTVVVKTNTQPQVKSCLFITLTKMDQNKVRTEDFIMYFESLLVS